MLSSSVFQLMPGPFHNFPIIHNHHPSQVALLTDADEKFVALKTVVICKKKARYVKLLKYAEYKHPHLANT
jgi:hypothetical protein